LLANNPIIARIPLQTPCFLDTETTDWPAARAQWLFSLALGWFEEGHVQVRQILARDFGEEKAALTYLKDIAAHKNFLSPSREAFDVNLLTTRFIMNRMHSDLAALPHLDLLASVTAAILGHRLENCRLVTLEADILGVRREGDIPGWEIPQRYFDWLKRRDPRLLADIFEHNRLDVISMRHSPHIWSQILTAQALAKYTAC